MLKRFIFEREDQPGAPWLSRFVAGRPETDRWYLGENPEDSPTARQCRDALRQHMPELLPQYDRACGLIGDDELAHRILSHYRPAPVLHGCSQAVWLGIGGPALIRNYDFPLDVVSDRFEATAWFGHEVIAKAQRPWGGCLDGMNEDGLVASLTAGGSASRGRGFSIILMLRYVLETCRRVDEAIATLRRIPVALSQNVTLLDRSGDHATLFLGPDRTAGVSRARVCTNHQEQVPPSPSPAMARSVERQSILLQALEDPTMTLSALVDRFLAAPLYSRHRGFTTVYTAIYRPTEGRVDYLWPGKSCRQHIGRFEAGEYTHDYGALSA
jgi:predicted choloylglycine hydrolase